MRGKSDMMEMMAHVHLDKPEWMHSREVGNGRDLINSVLADWEPIAREAIVKSLMMSAAELTGESDGPFYWITVAVLGVQIGREMGRMRVDTPEPEGEDG